ncbi:unnamed protein product [Adineta ricciae]|uniref:Poly [ADP-ribose] polymerase n=2 Tax=Adineta ricciae TaxID=249248 RepID=A0A814ZQ01_ADIRI|nr:unnamed protein product [Adineta ricciae]
MGVSGSKRPKAHLPSSRVSHSLQDEELICAVCKGILWQPVRCGNCQRSFCDQCLQTRISKKEPCGNTSLPCVAQNCPETITEKLSQLRIPCRYKQYGCPSCARYSRYDQLLKHEENCAYELITCSVCMAKVLKLNSDEHNQKCPLAIITCDECCAYYTRQDASLHTAAVCCQTLATNKIVVKYINVCVGSLITQKTDVIVVNALSCGMLESVLAAGGNSVRDSYTTESESSSAESVLSVVADGQLASKKIYFVEWRPGSNSTVLRRSIRKLFSETITEAVNEGYQSISFPAIGCGGFGCSPALMAEIFVTEVCHQLAAHPISIFFVIESTEENIYKELQTQIGVIKNARMKIVSTEVGSGTIEVENGEIAQQKMDVITVSASSSILTKAIIQAAGDEVKTDYLMQSKNQAKSLIISTPSGRLPYIISNVVKYVAQYHFTSIAFSAIGCDVYSSSTKIIIRTMIKFVISPEQIETYGAFCREVLTTYEESSIALNHLLPVTWEPNQGGTKRCQICSTTDEYKSVTVLFDQGMKGHYNKIIKIERIQNEHWFQQYIVHRDEFRKRLKADTEQRLYHGCPESAADSIINKCFNRSYGGVNGLVYGKGVYFSSKASYSNGFAVPNENGEKCMFIARVLIGLSAEGDSSMITPPPGYDTTTDGSHIFVTYHDAQAFAEYLITYK